MKPTSASARRRLLLVAALVMSGVVGAGLDRVAVAQQSGVKRTILTRKDDPGGATHEAVMGIAEIAPGARAGKHRHYGIELGYVLEGSVSVEHEGRPAMLLKAGDSFVNDGVHDALNPGQTPTKILAVYIVEKGKPLAEPVP